MKLTRNQIISMACEFVDLPGRFKRIADNIEAAGVLQHVSEKEYYFEYKSLDRQGRDNPSVFFSGVDDGFSPRKDSKEKLRIALTHCQEILHGDEVSGGYKGDCVVITDPDFPKELKATPKPPGLLWFEGNINLLSEKKLSIVGTRGCTSYGIAEANRIVDMCATRGIATVSGLAIGIDSAVHEASLEVGVPTIAVLPSGLDNILPRRNIQLAKKIVSNGGLLLTEVPPGRDYAHYNYPQRNRIIAGLSLATVVVEAAVKSGAMGTAKYALESSRSVFVSVGDVRNEKLAGNFNLLDRDLAKPVTPSCQLILEDLQYSSQEEGTELENNGVKLAEVASQRESYAKIWKSLSTNEQLIFREVLNGSHSIESLQMNIPLKVLPSLQMLLAQMLLRGVIGRDNYGNLFINA